MSGVSPQIARTSPTRSPADRFTLTLWTSDLGLARAADVAGVDRIGVDLERMGKAARQRNLATWISPHTIEDLRAISGTIEHATLFARVNPLHPDSPAEIDTVIAAGTRTLMLPMVANTNEAARFVALVDGRAAVILLVECKEAAAGIDELVSVPGVSEVHIGLNDLALSLGLASRWHLLASDIVETIAASVLEAGLRVGVGGIGRAGDISLPIPSDLVYAEYARTGATSALLARSFYAHGLDDIAAEVIRARTRLEYWRTCPSDILAAAHAELGQRAHQITSW